MRKNMKLIVSMHGVLERDTHDKYYNIQKPLIREVFCFGIHIRIYTNRIIRECAFLPIQVASHCRKQRILLQKREFQFKSLILIYI